MRIGIMGGTFDPIHNGHLMLGEYAYQQFHLDEVWYMPNGNPPHKSNPEIRKDLQDRAEMTRLAIEEIPYFRLCTYEMDRKETSYSYQTMEYFKETYPQDEFYFIIGADSLFNLESFKGFPQEAELPSAPKQFIRYMTEDNRPQVKLDVDYENGMGISIGRLREDSLYDYKFIGLSHNTVRGAAGGAVLCAETLTAKGFITKK